MPCTIEFDEKDRILEVVYQGEFHAPEMHASTLEIIGAILEKQTLRVLLDCSAAHFDVPTVGVYQLPDLYVERGVSRQMRAAVVLPLDRYKIELFEFYEDVCRNRGYFVKLFEDPAEARDWLLET